MPSDIYIGSLLRTLISSKPGGNFLELGTGMSLSLSWMVDGMDSSSRLISLDNDPQLIQIAREFFATDERIQLHCVDGEKWIREYEGEYFDLIFADTWPGKYFVLEETLALLNNGGLYIIDDMNPQPNWPDGHAEKVRNLISYLENACDLMTSWLDWSTGVMICTKKRTPKSISN